jgi:drug/metabolite transporter (DMT)-like permease
MRTSVPRSPTCAERCSRHIPLFILCVLTAGLVWGAGGPALKWLYVGSGVAGIDFSSLAFARSLWSLPILAATAAFRWPRVFRAGDWKLFGGLAIINAAMNVMFPLAGEHTSASHLTLIYGATAPIVAVFEAVFRKVSLDNQRKLAAVCGALGVLVVSFTKSTTGASLFGDSILFVWLLGFGAQAVITKILCTRYSAGFVIGFSWGISALIILAAGLPFGLQHELQRTIATPGVAFAFLGVLVFGMTFLAPIAFARATKSMTAAIATGATYYIAIFVGLVLSVTVIGERIGAGAIAGAVLLLLGIALMMTYNREQVNVPFHQDEPSL